MIRKTTTLIAGLGAAIGAGVMFLLDPAEGRRRRALTRDKMTHYGRKAGRATTRTGHDIWNRARGTAYETTRKMKKERVPDGVLVDRVRSEMGHVVHDPTTVVVTCRGGHVTLAGEVPEPELDGLLERVAATPGVAGVENQLRAGSASLQH